MTIGMDPDIGTVGDFTVSWHGLMMALGIAIALGFALYLARKDDFPPEDLMTPALWAIVAGLIGARLTHVIDEWDHYSEDLGEILLLWEGGLGWYGGLIGGAIGGAISAKIRHVPLGQLFDIVAAPVMLGLAVGRIGCTINGDVCGDTTSLPWGITYTHPASFPVNNWDLAGETLHPVAVYELLCCLSIVGILMLLRWKRLRPDGSIFFSMVALYSLARFFLSWLRAPDMEPAIVGSLHQAHIFSLALFVLAAAYLLWRRPRWEKEKETPVPEG